MNPHSVRQSVQYFTLRVNTHSDAFGLPAGFQNSIRYQVLRCIRLFSSFLLIMDGLAIISSHLAKQDLEKLNVGELTPLTPEVISRQATLNIGTIGHVAHGKSTVVKAISGVQTVRFKNELERNITIKLGYANAKVW